MAAISAVLLVIRSLQLDPDAEARVGRLWLSKPPEQPSPSTSKKYNGGKKGV
ncbi:hypothetical protein SAY87_009387 [Trapa incisa]|uniref:Uncharacterized protein n=1 Tax=Trapa incisa TaxID=236973 RepID=A0AAN7Q2I5_9MYRT|nr:hypothetical protein SAY87_009387 [Trapa incisa]